MRRILSETLVFITVSSDRAAALADAISAWDLAWGTRAATMTGDPRRRGRVAGCASFWLRGGVETVAH